MQCRQPKGIFGDTSGGAGGGLEAGNWKLETGNWKPETGSWKLEVGDWKVKTEVSVVNRGLQMGGIRRQVPNGGML
jgi:hypothetical protein